MKPIESSAGTTLNRPSLEQRATVAELAAKVAALPHDPAARHGLVWWICHASLWLVSLGLLAAALLRIFYHDGTHVLTWINAFTSYVYLPVYVSLAWALWMRRWLLTIVSISVVGLHVAWMLPDFVPDRRFPTASSNDSQSGDPSPTVRIFFANVLATNHDFKPLWQEIEQAAPDVVVLAECSRFSDRSFRQTPALAPYVHTNGPRRSQMGEVRIYSKLPIKFESQSWIVGRVVQKIEVEVGERTLRVIGLHAPRPQLPEYNYFGYYEKLIPLLTSESGPVVIVGDFNATQHSHVYKRLKEGGLRSAHDDRGRGYATTWPNKRWLVPPIRIDQAFVTRDVECINISEGRGIGSDHKPLVVDVALRHAASAESVPTVVE
jgi:endonuclease/exonuclease/phosphatase (EEP) superfamily protein YafD